MSVISLIVVLIIIGVLLWGVSQIPMPQWVRVIIQVIAIIAVVVYVAHFFGVAVHLLR